MAWRIKSGRGRTYFSDEEKIEVLAAIEEGTPAREAASKLYASKGKEVPKNVTMSISNWRKSLQRMVDDGDEELLKLCEEAGIAENDPDYEPEEEPAKAPPKKKATSTAAKK